MARRRQVAERMKTMKCVVLAAGYATRLYPLTENFPKPLLEIAGKTILDHLLRDLENIDEVDEYIIVSNHRYYGHFKKWGAMASFKKPLTILDDGSKSNETRLGAVRDLLFAVKTCGIDDDIFVLAGDHVIDFSFASFVAFFKEKNASAIMCFIENDINILRASGILTLRGDFKVVDMIEKPKDPPTNWASPPFYLYRREDLPLISACIENGGGVDAPGHLAAYVAKHSSLYAMVMPGNRYDIGDYESYARVKAEFSAKK